MPCPHHDIKIIQRSNHQSAVASAAYQSGERLFSEYDQKQKYYSHKSEIVHTEIMLPPHAPPAYADRNTLWNAAEAIEKQWNSQLARRIVLAIPREIPPEQHADLIRDYCREFFVSKGMIADFAIHDKGNGNPHAHILLTMRAMDENGKWLPKSRKVYDLDENGERIRLPSGSWKSHKEDTVDWNDQKYGEIWRQGWAATANRYLEANGRPERLDLRSYERQGLDKIPTVHMGPAVSQMEKRGIQTNIGNLNRDIKAANSLMQSIRQMVRHLKGWIADLKEKKAALLEALQESKEPTLPELLGKYLDLRREERTGWTSKGQLTGSVADFNKVMEAIRYLREKEGELIFRLVYQQAGCKKPFSRLWLSSMEENAIREGFQKLKPSTEYDTLYNAALCRERADWMVGINASRLFSCLYNQPLAVGRVMTPVLAMTVVREAAISAFVPEKFYTVALTLADGGTASSKRFAQKADAELLLSKCRKEGRVTVQKMERKEKSENPPQLYDLTALQRDANRLLGFTAQQTLDYAQSLYEKRLITYPRTDSRFLTEDMAASLPGLVTDTGRAFTVEESFPIHVQQVINGSKVTDHHALLPTKSMANADLAALPAGERNVLRLIAARLLCAVGEPHRYAETTLTP